jgi:hypothetical protein
MFEIYAEGMLADGHHVKFIPSLTEEEKAMLKDFFDRVSARLVGTEPAMIIAKRNV